MQIKYRVLKAYKSFFRRIKESKSGKKIKPGFPRFKSKDKYYSITYPQDNGSFTIVKKNKKQIIRISRIGGVQIEMHREIEGKIKTLTIKKNAGEYYAIFTTINEIKVPEVKNINLIGIDLGLNSFVALSDGTKIEKPKFMLQKRKKIAKWQRIVARRNNGSKRRNKAKQKLQNAYNEATNQSNDFMHKLSNELVNSSYTSFAVERLSIQNMVRNHSLAQSIYNASWNRFMQFLSYKAESAGMRVIKVNARNTSKQCSNCSNIQDMPLSKRIYNCDRCGMQLDRDINASINILKRATLGQRESHAQGDMTSAVQQALKSRIEELRTDKTCPLQDAMSV